MMKVGCCGFPVKREIYYKTFPAVEIQQTFYQLPRTDTGRRWKAEAPSDEEESIQEDLLYTRLHGRKGYRYTYSEIEMKELIEIGKPYPQTYILFNNVSMFEDAQRIKALLEYENIGMME